MADELVAIARFHSPIEANLAQAKLASAGIEASLENDVGEAISGGPHGGTPIQLEVTREDARAAVQILQQHMAEPAPERKWSDPVEVERCPVCESSFVEVRQSSVLGQVFRAMLSSLFPIPASVLESKSRACGVCGHRWKSSPLGTSEPPRPWE